MTAFGFGVAALAILTLTAAAGVGLPHLPHAEDRPKPSAKGAKARAPAQLEEEEADEAPGFGIVSIGAVIHGLLAAQAALRRMLRGRRKSPASAVSARTTPSLSEDTRPPWLRMSPEDEPLSRPEDFAPRAKTPSAPVGGQAAPAAVLSAATVRSAAPTRILPQPRGEWVMPPLAMLSEPKKVTTQDLA